MTEGRLILIAGALLAVGLGATLVAGRLRVPGLVLSLGLGMAMGSDGLGLIHFDDPELARTIGVVALCFILFEGGLAAGWREIRPVLLPAISLALVGTLITAAVVGLAAVWLLGLSTLEGLLLGSIVSATDSAAIFSVLRASSLKRRLAQTLEAESGLNDPVAVLLVLGFIDWIQKPGYGLGQFVALFAEQAAIGAAVGVVAGAAAVYSFRHMRLGTQGLYPVASIAFMALAFGAADVLGGSGFLAVYLAGLALGSSPVPARRTVADFHDGMGWVSQIALFFTLGLLVFPSGFGAVAVDAILIAAVLMLVARPLAAVTATAAMFPLRESLLMGWAGLRGAVPIVLATFPVIDGVPKAGSFFNLVFFVVLTSTLLQGATFEPLAKRLGLTTDRPALPRPLMEIGRIRRLGAEVLEFPIGPDDAARGRLVNELGLPREALVSVIVRAGQALLPRGSTQIEADDRLHILVREPVRAEVEALFALWRDGPFPERGELGSPALLGRAAIFTVRAWRVDDGDEGDPRQVAGVAVAQRLRVRRERPGALVQLEDGRYAVTGDGVVAVGASRQVFRFCTERIRRARDSQGRAWWQEVAGALSQRGVA